MSSRSEPALSEKTLDLVLIDFIKLQKKELNPCGFHLGSIYHCVGLLDVINLVCEPPKVRSSDKRNEVFFIDRKPDVDDGVGEGFKVGIVCKGVCAILVGKNKEKSAPVQFSSAVCFP
jgi:hypothetical protein